MFRGALPYAFSFSENKRPAEPQAPIIGDRAVHVVDGLMFEVKAFRGELAIRRERRATNLYPVGSGTCTMMQSCASAATLRGGGPILNRGLRSHVQ
jgi:hypothetical protein